MSRKFDIIARCISNKKFNLRTRWRFCEMKNMTAQLFEYLLAARNSNLPADYDLNGCSTYWFLDEVLSLKGTRLIEKQGDRTSFMEIERPVLNIEKVEASVMLNAVFKLLQYDETTNEMLTVTSEQLEEILSLEYEALKQKISSQDKTFIILNDWQQLLLGVPMPKIRIDLAISKFDQRKDIVLSLVNEYQNWQWMKAQANEETKQVTAVQELYDYVVNLNFDSKKEQSLYLGIGILHVPSEPAIYHPVLTLRIKIETDHSKGTCRLKFQDPLKVDAILDHLLFDDLDAIEELRNEIEKSNITAFDDVLIADILKKVIARIHPNGKYLTSPVDVANTSDDAPQLLHRSVLFLKQEEADKLAQRLKKTANELRTHDAPSDVLGSVVDPNYLANGDQDSEFLKLDQQCLFPMPFSETEANILQLLNEHSAVAVFEEDKMNKFPIISNLITHFMGYGKRILVLAEDINEIEGARSLLPSYLEGLHTVVSTKPHEIKLLKENLYQSLAGQEKYKALYGTSKMIDCIEKTKIKSDEIKKQIVDYRELCSKKFFWKGKRYFPYELAQLISKLGGAPQLTSDVIPINARFSVKGSEIEKIWALKSYFTPENMDLLNYDFIDIDELMKYHGYQKLLVTEEKYLRLCSEHQDLESMFEDETDIRFIQYLFEQLPKLMKDVAEIKAPYGKRILKEAMIDLDSYHALAASVDRINRGIEDIPHLNGETNKRDSLIQKLNELLHIERSELPLVSNDAASRESLHEFYIDKKANMTKALRVAHLIWIFNEGAFALSKNFKGVSAEGIGIMNILYRAAAIHLSKVEVKIGWSRVRSHFIRMYQPLIQQKHIHPVCLDLYETLKHHSFSDFKAVLSELNDKITTRHQFTIFGHFISEMGHLMPHFTAKVMADIDAGIETVPDFKAAFEQGKLNALFEQLKRYESETLEQKHEYFETYQLELQHELITRSCWKDKKLPGQKTVLELIELLDESFFNNRQDLKRIFSSFPAIFVPLNQESILEKVDSDQFDIVIFVDASSSTVFRLPDLMHAHKAILFGNAEEKLEKKEVVSASNLRKLTHQYGQVLHNFGEQYLDASLFDLVAHSAAWDARVKPSQSFPLTLIKGFEFDIKKDTHKCDNVVEEEVFEALTKFGYDIKCKVKAGNLLLDFLIEGEENSLAVNVIGDTRMQREMIKKQLEQEIVLKNQGLNVYTIGAPNYYLNPRQTLLTIYEKLEELNIYPIK